MKRGDRRPAPGARVGVVAALMLVAAPFGCDDGTPVDPCDRDLACAVAGVDIAILDVEPRWADDQPYDATLDARVVEPGDEIEVDVLVMNRGTIDSSDEALLIGYVRDHDRALVDSVEVEPLDVGERATVTLVFEVPAGPRWLRSPGYPAQLDSLGEFRLEHDGYVDEDSANDRRPGFEFVVDAPLLELRLDAVPDTMHTLTTYGASIVIVNHSEASPFAGGLVVQMCALYFDGNSCADGAIESFSPVTLGPTPASTSRTQPLSLRMDMDALVRFDEVQSIAIAPCVPLASGTRDCITPAGFDPSTAFTVTAIPNLLVECEPPELADGQTVNVADALCEHGRDGDLPTTFGIASFDASAGQCWRADFTSSSSGSIELENAATLELVPAGQPGCAQVERSGSHYVIVYPSSPGAAPSGTILLDRVR